VRGVPIHADLVELLCPLCHTALHRVWLACGLDGPADVDILARRLALFLNRRTRPLTLEQTHALAGAWQDIAGRLSIAHMKEQHPDVA
jgi:hypothetical protein